DGLIEILAGRSRAAASNLNPRGVRTYDKHFTHGSRPSSVEPVKSIRPHHQDQNFTTARPTTPLPLSRARYSLICSKPMVLMVCWILPSAASAMTSLRSALLPQKDP